MALVVLWDIMLYNVFGWEAIKYLLLATYFSLSVHPFAIHFIAEHFEFLSF
jgi:sphingolipid delta-4 desaturase